jgi:HSP20 family protein
MTALTKRERTHVEPRAETFDRWFDDWMKLLPFRRPTTMFGGEWVPEELIRVDEFRENGSFVVRAELPGVDPEKDVELTVVDGTLRIAAERREEEKTEETTYRRHELRYGSFSRVLPLPEGVTEADVKATYRDGILEVRFPAPLPAAATKIPVTAS